MLTIPVINVIITVNGLQESWIMIKQINKSFKGIGKVIRDAKQTAANCLVSTALVIFLVNCYAMPNNNKDINAYLIDAMKAYNVPVVGYAIIDHNKVILAETLSIDPHIHVSKDSLFQAASISKSVSAYYALKLVDQKKLNLDESVNDYLTSWKIPLNRYNKNNPVTLRQILSMTSGLSVSGFPGHLQGEPLPTLKEILDGKSPANTPPIRVFYQPGSRYFYSGGGYEVLQQLIDDVTKKSFDEVMNKQLLVPLGMNHSIFQYPLNDKLRKTAVSAFDFNGKMLKGGWNNYAISAAGGLWSTPTDLAKFAISMTNSYLGNGHNFITKSLALKMLMHQKNSDYGLGVVVNGQSSTLNFRKAGHNLGYHSQLIMFPNSGKGVVIMTDSENGDTLINYLVPIIAHEYNWPCYFPYFDELVPIPKFSC